MHEPQEQPSASPDWLEIIEVVQSALWSSVDDDVVGEALLVLVSAWRSGASVEDWRAYGRTVARRTASRHARRERHRQMLNAEQLPNPVPEKRGFKDWFRARFLPSLTQRLSMRQLSVLQLYLSGTSVREIARRLGTQPKSVRESLRGIIKKAVQEREKNTPPSDL